MIRVLFKAVSFKIFLLYCFQISGQIVFHQKEYNFGELTNWSQNPAVFDFYNPGPEEDAILKTVKSTHVHVKYPNTYIPAGSSGKVMVYFEPPDIGKFNEKIKIYTALSEKPIELTVTGFVSSVLECPSLNLPADKSLLLTDVIIEVIDKNTRLPVSSAKVNLVDGSGKSISRKTSQKGIISLNLSIGMYYLTTTAEGYYPHDDYYYINKNTGKIVVELVPITEMSFDNPDIPVSPEPGPGKDEKQPEMLKVTGIVVDSLSGSPVKGAMVRLSTAGKPSMLFTTHDDGIFQFNLKNIEYQLNVKANGYLPYSKKLAEFSENDTIVVRLKTEIPVPDTRPPVESSYIEISGIVVDAITEKPVPNASMKFFDVYQVPSLFTTYKDGLFRKKLKKGEYRVTIKAKGYQPFEDTLVVEKSRSGIIYALLPENRPVVTEEPVPVQPVVVPQSTDTSTELPKELFTANNLVFLIDVSSSMNQYHKLENLKISMIRLTKVLRDIDRVSLISFSTKPSIHFVSVPSDQKDSIIRTISDLTASGLTFGIKGLETAYQIALENYIEGGNNQLIIATDGDFNSPDFSEIELIGLITKYASKGITLSVLGFKTDEKSLRRMKRMAAFGKGSLLVIEDENQAKSVLIEEIREKSRKKE